MSSLQIEDHYAKIDGRGRIFIPAEFRQLLSLKKGSWAELQIHIVDNTPTVIITKAISGVKK